MMFSQHDRILINSMDEKDSGIFLTRQDISKFRMFDQFLTLLKAGKVFTLEFFDMTGYY